MTQIIEFSLSNDLMDVKVGIDPNVANMIYSLDISCSDKVHAALLLNQLRKVLASVVERIRTEEYNNGYKDGRSKRGKKSWFSTLLK